MLGEPKTYVYVAGLEKMRDELDAVFRANRRIGIEVGSPKAELKAGGRWVELLY